MSCGRSLIFRFLSLNRLPSTVSASLDFLHFFRRAETDLRAFIGSVIRDPHAREDIFQEVSRTLWERFDDYDLERPFGAWARGIASRKMLEARRRAGSGAEAVRGRPAATFPADPDFTLQ